MLMNRCGKSFNPFGVELGKIADTPESKAFWRAAVPEKPQVEGTPAFLRMKRSYRRMLEAATLVSLGVMLVAFQVMRGISLRDLEAKAVDVKVEVMDIPVTEQLHRPPPPPRPLVPIPTEDESVPEDATIASTNLDLSDLPAPPPPPAPVDETAYTFVPYDSPPTPVGGWAEIYKYVVYPELAIRAGIEGIVFIKALVNEKGIVEDAAVMKSSGANVGFEEAALQAARKIRWKPALQREHPIKVWIGFPVKFKLSDDIRG